MNVPKTHFSTELHTGRRVLRRRLEDLFAAPRRRGVLPLACALLLVSMLGSLVACRTAPAPSPSAPTAVTELQTAPLTAENQDVHALYAQILKTLLDENRLPDDLNDPGDYIGTVAEREAMAENQFAVCDVDGDGREELVIQYLTANMVAGMRALIYDTDENGGLRLQFSEFPNLTFYDNGAIQAGWSHNQGLAEGTLDANYFQHTPYLNSYNESNGTDLVSAALIHYEPFGLYGNGVDAVADIAPGATILIPADDSNETRALLLLAQEGLITLPEDASAEAGVTTLDIVDNGGFDIQAVQADTVPAQLANSDVGTLAVINGNYALQAGLNVADALAIEDASGDAAQTYANIVACRNGDESSEKIQALVNALLTDSVKTYIADTYNGAVVAIF